MNLVVSQIEVLKRRKCPQAIGEYSQLVVRDVEGLESPVRAPIIQEL